MKSRSRWSDLIERARRMRRYSSMIMKESWKRRIIGEMTWDGVLVRCSSRLKKWVLLTILGLSMSVFGPIGCGPDLLERVDTPLTLAEARARGEKTFPFPDSAHDIYFAVYGEWQEYDFLLRFQAPPEDCLAAIPAVIAWHNHESRQSSNYKPAPLNGRTTLPRSSSLSPVRWFDSAVIERGICAGENGGHTPNIWVDTDKGIFYFQVHD